jgi:multidrug efflux pump subunit AcrB
MDALKTIVIPLSSGDIIHLTDVADVRLTDSSTSFSRQNGMENIGISISQNQSANTIVVCNQLVEKINELNASGNGLNIEITENSGATIMDNIYRVVQSLLGGLLIAMLVLFVFLGEMRSALIISTAMPLSVFAALVMMSAWGMTINIMSLGGLVVGVGMMVDSSIIMLERGFVERVKTGGYQEAILQAAHVVGSSLISSTATTIVVFLPISLMSGMAGQLFRDVGFTIVFSLMASLISALTIVPLLFVNLKPLENRLSVASKLVRNLSERLGHSMGAALRHKYLSIFAALVLLAGTAVMFTQIDMELMPSMDRGMINLSLSTKEGLSAEATNKIAEQVEKIVADLDAVDTYSMRSSGGSASISLTLKEDRKVSTDEIVELLREKTKDIENCYIDVSRRNMMSFGSSSNVSFNLTGKNLDSIKTFSQEVSDRMKQFDGVISVSTSMTDGESRAELVVDPVKPQPSG